MTLDLTNALNRILTWLKQNKSNYVNCLQPGLSKTEIDQIVQDLPFTIPSEIYELYQWRNGAIENDDDMAGLFAGWSFYPLQELVSNYKKGEKDPQRVGIKRLLNLESSDLAFYINKLTPLNVFYNLYLWGWEFSSSIWLNQNLVSHPVVFDWLEQGDFEVIAMYTSLSTMMQTIAECYETGAYYPNPESLHIGYFFYSNSEKEEIIWRKYNSSLIELALQALNERALSGWFFAHFSKILITFKDKRAVKALIKSLESLDNSSSSHLKEELFTPYPTQANIINILGEIGDVSALEVISRFTDHENYWINKAAQSAVVKLKQIENETG